MTTCISLHCRQLFTTCYMSTANSSSETQERARRLAEQIGSNHISINIDEAISANVAIFAQVRIKQCHICMYYLCTNVEICDEFWRFGTDCELYTKYYTGSTILKFDSTCTCTYMHSNRSILWFVVYVDFLYMKDTQSCIHVRVSSFQCSVLIFPVERDAAKVQSSRW